MAESSLSYQFSDLQVEAADAVGWTRDSSNWSSDETDRIAEAVNTGYRWFLWPSTIDGQDFEAHQWSFLKLTNENFPLWDEQSSTISSVSSYDSTNDETTVTAAATMFYSSMIGKSLVVTGGGTYTIKSYTSGTVVVVTGDASGESAAATITVATNGNFLLPDDLAGIEGPGWFQPDESEYREVPLTGEAKIQIKRMRYNDTSGTPQVMAIRNSANYPTTTEGQRWELIVWPTPDAVYTLGFRYQPQPSKLSASNPYPYGGASHSALLVAAVRAAAEYLYDDQGSGRHMQQFLRLLTSSISQDVDMLEPDYVGQMLDRRNHRGGGRLYRHELKRIYHKNDPDWPG